MAWFVTILLEDVPFLPDGGGVLPRGATTLPDGFAAFTLTALERVGAGVVFFGAGLEADFLGGDFLFLAMGSLGRRKNLGG